MPRAHPITVTCALLIGAACYLMVPAAFVVVPAWAWIAIAAAGVGAIALRIKLRLPELLALISRPDPKARVRAAVAIAVVAIVYLYFTASRQDRDFFAKTLDDQSYVIQARMLAHGRLWMPQHPCADFFDSFHMLSRPVYASAYFPGTALMYVPLVWLGLPMWIGPLIVSGAIIGLLYRIVTDVADGVAGVLAALIVVSSNWFRMLSILVYGQTPALLLGLLMFWAWLRWRENPKAKWAVLIGVFFGWLAITRPADAICYALAMVATTVLYPFLSTDNHGFRVHAVKIAYCAAGALPFLAIEVIQNVGVTGRLTQTPFSLYLDRDQPGANFGFHSYDPAARPQSLIVQKQVYFDEFIVPFIERHTPGQIGGWMKEHLPQIVDVTLPARALLVLLLPVGLLGLARDQRRWALALTFPLFLLFYFGYPPFVEHYAVPFMPAVAMLVAMAPGVLRAIPRIGDALYLAGIVLIGGLSLAMLPDLNSKVKDETFVSPMMRGLHGAVDDSAVILFRYHPELPQDADNSYKIEPVYNIDVAWPDDAPIIRAHDLGNRNIEIFRYYARRDPQRTFFLFDRANPAAGVLRLGTARELGGE